VRAEAWENRAVIDAESRLIGRTLGGYTIESWLGRGSTASVYLATHARSKGKVALKVPSVDTRDKPALREHFLRKARLAASLDHPNVIPIYDAGEDNGRLYLAMGYAEGGDLRRLLDREQRLSLVRTIFIVEQVASALDAAHAVALLHLDVKLTNILLGETGRVCVADFGRALTMASADTSDSQALYRREPTAADIWRDIHGLGHTAYQCLVGQPPSELAALRANKHGLRAVSSARPGLPHALDDVLTMAMARPPKAHYKTAGSMAEAFRLAGLGPPSKGITLLPERASS
jgi:serine/threonine protein kinase